MPINTKYSSAIYSSLFHSPFPKTKNGAGSIARRITTKEGYSTLPSMSHVPGLSKSNISDRKSSIINRRILIARSLSD